MLSSMLTEGGFKRQIGDAPRYMSMPRLFNGAFHAGSSSNQNECCAGGDVEQVKIEIHQCLVNGKHTELVWSSDVQASLPSLMQPCIAIACLLVQSREVSLCEKRKDEGGRSSFSQCLKHSITWNHLEHIR